MGLLQVLQRGVTVGEVAGMISGATSIVSLTLPLFVALILVWSIKNKQLNASSWSTAAKTLQGTLWPTLLRSDSARSDAVTRRVGIASTMLTVVVVLLLAVHIVTPLPLVEEIQTKSGLSSVSFDYAPDLTFFGLGTAQRPSNPMRRSCGYLKYTDCTPSDELFDKLSSGSVGTTIAGPKDIQFRNFFLYQNQSSNNENIVVGLTRPMQYLVLNTEYTIVEGLIVDPNNGGIGFRNHTIPVGLPLGATWQEDILWIQPETVCTANNFSIHFPYGSTHVNEFFPGVDTGINPNEVIDRYIQDDGAFAHRDWSIPSPDWSITGPNSLWNISGPIPDLAQRSFLGAWWDNYFSAGALDISANSNSQVGTQYNRYLTNYTSIIDPFQITISNIDGAIFDQSMAYNIYKFVAANLDRFFPGISNLIPGVVAAYEFSANFMEYGARCFGFDDSDSSDPLKPYIRCGNLYGVASPDDPNLTEFQINSMFGQPVYTCASSMKAIVKTIEFSFNGTSSLNNTVVLSVADKNYTNPEDVPLWGVEKVDPSQNLNITDINLLWGLVSNKYENDSNIATIRAKQLYLPVANSDTDMSVFKDSLAATSVFSAAWNSVYQEVAWVSGTSFGGLPSYSGDIQYSLFLKWQEFSSTKDGAAKILNLIWTDLVASALVGTVTGFENNTGTRTSGSLGQRQVHKHHSVVVYGNLLFAIPAFVVLVLWAGLLVTSLVLFISRKVTGDMLSYYMNQTSLGRAVLNAEQSDPRSYPPQSDLRMIALSSKQWAAEYGSKTLGIRAYRQAMRSSALPYYGPGNSPLPTPDLGESFVGSMEMDSLREGAAQPKDSNVQLYRDDGYSPSMPRWS